MSPLLFTVFLKLSILTNESVSKKYLLYLYKDKLFKMLHMSYDNFIRSTSTNHWKFNNLSSLISRQPDIHKAEIPYSFLNREWNIKYFKLYIVNIVIIFFKTIHVRIYLLTIIQPYYIDDNLYKLLLIRRRKDGVYNSVFFEIVKDFIIQGGR